MKPITYKHSFIFFVRLADDRVQEMSFKANTTREAVRLLLAHLNKGDEIMSCYKEVKNWNRIK